MSIKKEKYINIVDQQHYDYREKFKTGGTLLILASIAGIIIDSFYNSLSGSGTYLYGMLMGGGLALRWAYHKMSWTIRSFKSILNESLS